jgi:hypothetical protein
VRVVVAADGTWNGRSVRAGFVYYFAGTGSCGTLSSASINTNSRAIALPASYGIAIDKFDDVYFQVGGLILRVSGGLYNAPVSSSGRMTTFFGTSTTASSSCPSSPTFVMTTSHSMAIDSSNNLYFSSPNCFRIWLKSATSSQANYVLGTGSSGSSAVSGQVDGLLTAIESNYGIALDVNGNLFYNDLLAQNLKMLRKSDNKVYLIAGPSGRTCTGVCDEFVTYNSGGTAILQPRGVAVGSAGKIFSVAVTGVVYTISGLSYSSPPTSMPTSLPSPRPTLVPTFAPTALPTILPTASPSFTRATYTSITTGLTDGHHICIDPSGNVYVGKVGSPLTYRIAGSLMHLYLPS